MRNDGTGWNFASGLNLPSKLAELFQNRANFIAIENIIHQEKVALGKSMLHFSEWDCDNWQLFYESLMVTNLEKMKHHTIAQKKKNSEIVSPDGVK